MKIGQKQSPSYPKGGLVVVLTLVFALGFFLGGRNILAEVEGWLSFATQLVHDDSAAELLPTLVVDMGFDNYNNLLQQREEALQTGVTLLTNQDFVTATMRLDDSLVPVTMRFYPGPAEHLKEASKWHFDVRTRRGQHLEGMQRFYLLDPAEDNWLNQWAFARSLEREGVLATRTQFVNLVFNGDSWGPYALQEGFGDELMTANGRTAGVILEFDADLLWRSIAHFGDAERAYADPVGNLLATDFRFFEIDAFRDATIAQDTARLAQRDAAVSRLRALQAGQLPASDIFEVEAYGRFLALVDLWGANEAVSLPNLRYYYDPDSGRLEPIGFNGNPLSSEERLPLIAAYGDAVLQAAYAREAERLGQPAYLAELESELGEELLHLQRALRPEAGQLALPWAALQQRQEQIRRSLNPIQPVFAYLGPPTMSVSATIQVDVANVINLPVEVIGFDINGTTFLEADPAWLRTAAATDLVSVRGDQIILSATGSSLIRYVRFHLPTTEIIRLDQETDFTHPIEINVATRILGLDEHQFTLAREGAPDQFIAP
ncbi:MAG: CotH kinase family protein [Anaerolineae bacterium]|jgi:hypothetical protein